MHGIDIERWAGKIAVVTGASSGIGAAIVLDLVRAGLTVVGLARRVELIEALKSELVGASGRLVAKRCDVTSLADVTTVFDAIAAEVGYVNILISNAGSGVHGLILQDGRDAGLQAAIDCNVNGLLHVTRATYRHLRASEDYGHLIYINSVFGHNVVPMGGGQQLNVYPGTKHFITATTEVLRQELNQLANRKVRVTSISPGLVETEIFAKAGFENTDVMYQMWPSLKPSDVALTVHFALAVPPSVQIKELIVKAVGESF